MKTRAQALREAGLVVAEARAIFSLLTPAESAQRVWRAGGPSVEALTEMITRERAATRP